VSAQEQTLTELAELLDRLRIPYMVIGGMANAVWGEPRATLDIDATVWVRDADVAAAVAELGAAFRVLVPSPAEFIGRTRVLPLESQAGVRIDVIFGLLPFEEEAIRRAVVVAVAGVPVRFCTAEDLILHKIVSERLQDQADVRGVVRRRLASLDLGYLEPRIGELARLLDRPDIEGSWIAWKREASAKGGSSGS
jgi:hypothetical protein